MEKLNISTNKQLIAETFQQTMRVDFSVESTIETGMCSIIVDDLVSPSIFMLKNGIFRTFAGDSQSEYAEELIDAVPNGSIILPSTKGWVNRIKNIPQISLEKITRYSLDHSAINKSNLAKSQQLQTNYPIKPICLKTSLQLKNSINFNYHLQNFHSAQDFLANGTGYVALDKGEIIGAATSALVCSKGIEINIMVLPEYRDKGIALALGTNLVKDTLDDELIPHWDAGNEVSLKLATKLGYQMIKSYYAYRIKQ